MQHSVISLSSSLHLAIIKIISLCAWMSPNTTEKILKMKNDLLKLNKKRMLGRKKKGVRCGGRGNHPAEILLSDVTDSIHSNT